MWLCIFSGKQFADTFKKHIGEKSNKCNQCDYASYHAGSLREHLKMHSGEKSHKCNQCNFAFTAAIRVHLNSHYGGTWNICNQCNFASSHASSLRVHLKMRSGEKSNKCGQCNYGSLRPSSLKTHLKIHSVKKKKVFIKVHWECIWWNTLERSQTNATYVTSSHASALRRHLKINTGEKSWNVNNVIMHLFTHLTWKFTWKLIVEKRQINAISAIMHHLMRET